MCCAVLYLLCSAAFAVLCSSALCRLYCSVLHCTVRRSVLSWLCAVLCFSDMLKIYGITYSFSFQLLSQILLLSSLKKFYEDVVKLPNLFNFCSLSFHCFYFRRRRENSRCSLENNGIILKTNHRSKSSFLFGNYFIFWSGGEYSRCSLENNGIILKINYKSISPFLLEY